LRFDGTGRCARSWRQVGLRVPTRERCRAWASLGRAWAWTRTWKAAGLELELERAGARRNGRGVAGFWKSGLAMTRGARGDETTGLCFPCSIAEQAGTHRGKWQMEACRCGWKKRVRMG